jgi:hypothetical protein
MSEIKRKPEKKKRKNQIQKSERLNGWRKLWRKYSF